MGRPTDSPASNDKTDQLKAALANAQTKAHAYDVKSGITVSDGIDRWLSLHTIGNKPRSVDFNKEVVKFIKARWPEAMGKNVEQVTEAECLAFAESVAHYSASRYNGIISALRTAIPAAVILPRKNPPHLDHRIPTPEEFNRYLAALDTAQSGHSGLVVRFLAHTGMRITEAWLLKWSDVHEDHIMARAETTKSGKPRAIPFIKGTREVLKALKKVSHGGTVLPHRTCKTAFKYASRLTGLPRYSHHTFRHYFATRCILSGVDIPTVAKWLGHQDNGVLLLKTYCHLLDEHSVVMAERVKLGAALANPESLVSLDVEANNQRPVIPSRFGTGSVEDLSKRENIIMFQFRPATPPDERKAIP